MIRQVSNRALSTTDTRKVGRISEACLIWNGRLGMESGNDGYVGLLLGSFVRFFEEGEYMMVFALAGGQ
jgi:hypothetical protein